MSTPQQHELDPPLTHREAVRWEEGDEPDDETWRQKIREKLVTEARGEGCRPGTRLVVSTIDLKNHGPGPEHGGHDPARVGVGGSSDCGADSPEAAAPPSAIPAPAATGPH